MHKNLESVNNGKDPQFLYRYMYMTSKNLERTFTHNELYFASPKDVNDPFDCKPPLNFMDCADEEFMILLDATGKSFFEKYNSLGLDKIINPERTKDIVLDMLKKVRIKFLKESAVGFSRIIENVTDSLGLLCLSETPDNILMWSHYADKHRGIILQFDRLGLKKEFGYCQKIDYTNNVIDVKMLIDNLGKWDILLLSKKSPHWDYEREWRIITEPRNRHDKPNDPRVFKFPKEILTGVILGYDISNTDVASIRTWRNNGQPQARIYRAKKDNDSYTIKVDFTNSE